MLKRSVSNKSVPFYQQEPLRFECTGCGACCIAGADYYVYVNSAEIDKIADFLGVTIAWFKRRYLKKLPQEDWVLAVNNDETCIFLDKEKRCAIYSARPQQCSSYPYWPEVVLRKRDWLRESKRCEGPGRGKLLSKKMVTALLERQKQNGDCEC